MEHLKQEIIELYLLNKSLLEEKLDSVSEHLSECKICKAKLSELQEFYKIIEGTKLSKKPGISIKGALERQRVPEIYSVEDIFKSTSILIKLKTLITGLLKSARLKVNSLIKSIFANILYLFRGNKWVLAGMLTLLLIFVAYILIKINNYNEKPFITVQQVDTINKQNKQLTSENSSETNNNHTDGIDTNSKENVPKEKKIKKDSFDKSKTLIAYIPVSISMIRSNEEDIKYDFFTFYNKHYNRIGVVVFEKGIIDTTKPEKDIIRNIALKRDKHYILFPKTVLNDNPDGKNYLRSKEIYINPKEGIEINISDKVPQYNLDDEFVKYKFDNNFNIKNVDFNSKFLRKYETLIREKKIDSIPEEAYKKILKEEIKDLK